MLYHLTGWPLFYILKCYVLLFGKENSKAIVYVKEHDPHIFFGVDIMPLVMQSKPLLIGDLYAQPKSVCMCVIYVSKSLGLELKVYFAFLPAFDFLNKT